MAFSPLITRLYGPEVYGLQGVFMSVVALFSTAAALGYPTAILLPRDDQEAWTIVRLCLYVGLAFSCLVLIVIIPFGSALLQSLQAEALGNLVYLVPAALFLGLIGGVLNHWLTRQQAFRTMANYNVLTAFLMSMTKSGLGLVSPAAVTLVVTNAFGQFLGPVLAYARWRKTAKATSAIEVTGANAGSSLRTVARRYSDFPFLRTPQNVINAISQSLPILLLSSFFGSEAAGHYAIALSVLGVAPGLIGGAVMSVFYPKVNAAINAGENARSLIVRTTLGMAAVGALPFIAVVVFGPVLFSFVFGASWEVAGRYAQWLAPWLFLQYINKPAVAAIPGLRLQGGLLIYEIFSTGSKVAALWLGFKILGDDESAVAAFSIVGVAAYLWLILWVIRRCGQPVLQRT